MKLQIFTLSSILLGTFLMSGCAYKEDYTQLKTQTKVQPKPVVYTKINVKPVKVLSGYVESNENESQKKLYKKISQYLTSEYKKIIRENNRYTLSDSKDEDTLVLQSIISAVEVHYIDGQWKSHTPITLGLDSISFNAYMYEFVRILGESKLVDSITGKVISSSMKIQKKHKIKITGDDLVFEDIKPALDSWLVQVKLDLSSN